VLHSYKYEDHPELARPLGERLAALAVDAPDLVVPVPLHASRRRTRTYDQALYLAQRLAGLRGWTLAPGVLVRARATRRQVDQHRDARVTNVAGAFRVAGNVSGRHVLLVDDVVTTGATVAECARILKEAGARRVEVIAVARAA
jgi:ComF family protein